MDIKFDSKSRPRACDNLVTRYLHNQNYSEQSKLEKEKMIIINDDNMKREKILEKPVELPDCI